MEHPSNNPPDYENIKARVLRFLSGSKPEHALMMVRDLEALATGDACLFETIGKCYPGWTPGHFQILLAEIAPQIAEVKAIFVEEQEEIRTKEVRDRALFEKYSPQILDAFTNFKTEEAIKTFFQALMHDLHQEGEEDPENRAKQFILSCFSRQWNEDTIRQKWFQVLPDLKNIKGKDGQVVRVFSKEGVPEIMAEILRTREGRDLLATHRAEMFGVLSAVVDSSPRN